MRLGEPAITKYRTRRSGALVDRYRVRWRVRFDDGRMCWPSRSGFATRRLAETFIGNLRKAELQTAGWRFNLRGHPEHLEAGGADPSIFEALRRYMSVSWDTRWVAGSRRKVRGRLLVMAAVTIEDHAASDRIIAAMRLQRPGGERRHPETLEEWVARYLYDHALLRGDAAEPMKMGPELTNARRWLESRSLPLSCLNEGTLLRLRRNLTDGRPHSTARTYWATVTSFLHWTLTTRLIHEDPTLALPPIARDLISERVDPGRVLSESDVFQIAAAVAAGRPQSSREVAHARSLFVIITAFGALRVSEAAALRRQDITFDPRGGAWLHVEAQLLRTGSAYSDRGATLERCPTKGARNTRSRRIYIPARAANPLRQHLASTAAEPDTPIFTGTRGQPMCTATFRADAWAPAVASLFPHGHALSGITPHALRHAGMTWWLRSGMSHALVKQWGGWTSLKVMLDVYAGILPGDEDEAIARLEASDPTDATDATPGFTGARRREQNSASTTTRSRV